MGLSSGLRGLICTKEGVIVFAYDCLVKILMSIEGGTFLPLPQGRYE